MSGHRLALLIARRAHRATWDSIAVRSCIDAGFLNGPNGSAAGSRRRGERVSPRIAPRIHNPSPFVQTHGSPRLPRPYPEQSGHESLRNVPRRRCARSRVLKKVEDGRAVLRHTEVPQELSGLGYGSRLALGIFEALGPRWEKERSRSAPSCPPTPPDTPSTVHSSMAERRPHGTHARTALIGNDTSRLSNACPKGISNFVGGVRS